MKRVLIIEEEIKQYRLPFYEGLYAALRSRGIALRVAYGDSRPLERAKRDQCDLPRDYGLKVKGYWLLNRILVQPLFWEVASADLIVASEGTRFVVSQILLPFSACKLKKLALWGFGENKQAGRQAFSEWYKKKVLRYITWWFAYTAGAAEYLIRQGFPRERITTVQNAVDTAQISRWIAHFGPGDTARLRAAIGIPPASPIGVYCGALENSKNLPFLIESAKLIKRRIPDFHLLLIGGGPQSAYVETQVLLNSEWMHWTGPQFGEQKAALLQIADVFMMPGKVGLAILDSFAARLPLFTTRIPNHCPEIEYLEDGRNGLITENSVEPYSQAVADVLRDSARLAALKEGAGQSALKYSIEAMVNNFCGGVQECLNRS